MTAVDARVRVEHPCPYCDISAEFPRTLLLLWCDNRRDHFLVSSPEAEELRAALAAFRGSFHARPIVTEEREALVMVPDFDWTEPPSVTKLARAAGVWVLPPVVYFEGRETYRFLAPSRSRLNRLVTRLRRIGDVELLSVSETVGLRGVREVPTAVVHFFEGLTRKQARSLVVAYEGGLLDVPARAGWGEVARREGLSRSTFGEHLRKGQLRLLANSYEALKARVDTREEPVVLPATGPTRRRSGSSSRGDRQRRAGPRPVGHAG